MILRHSKSLGPWADKLAALPELRSEQDTAAARDMLRQLRQEAWATWHEVFGRLRKKAAEAVEAAEAAAAVEAAAEEVEERNEPTFVAMVEAADKAYKATGSYWQAREAARKVRDEMGWSGRSFVLTPDEQQAQLTGFINMIKGMAALTKADIL